MQLKPASPGLMRFLDVKRVLLLLPVFLLIAIAALLLTGRDDGASISAARLLDTTPSSQQRRSVGLDINDLAPDFEISTSEGRRLRLSELRGRPVLINFWATWCGSCLSEMPEIKALQEERGIEAFSVLAINAGETLPEARRFIDFLNAPFTYGLDPGLVVSDAYGVYGLPVSVFLDSDGVVQAMYNGHANRQRLEAYVNAAISARPPGALPDQLRLISTVPRERVLRVTKSSKGRIEFASRSLRCDSRYCADAAIETLKAQPGYTSVSLDSKRAEPALSVRYDAAAVGEDEVIRAVEQALAALSDPLYQTSLELRR